MSRQAEELAQQIADLVGFDPSVRAADGQTVASLLAPHLAGAWQPIESAPKNGKRRILAYPVVGEVQEVYWLQERTRSSWVASTGGFFVHPTIWQFVPTPPEGEQS